MKNKTYKRLYDNRFDDPIKGKRKKIANKKVRAFNKQLGKQIIYENAC